MHLAVKGGEQIAARQLEGSARELRIGVVTRLFDEAEPGVAAACEAAAGELPGRAEPVAIPLHEEISTIGQLVILPEATAAHLQWLRTRLADYGPDVRARLLAGLFLPSTAHVTGARQGRELWNDELLGSGVDELGDAGQGVVAIEAWHV